MRDNKTINRFRPFALLLACLSLAACGELRLELGEEEEIEAGFDLFRDCMEALSGHKALAAAIRASCLAKYESHTDLLVASGPGDGSAAGLLSAMPELTTDHDEANHWQQNWVRSVRSDGVITGIVIELRMSDELERDELKCEEEGVLCHFIWGTTWLVPGAPRKLVKYRGEYEFQSRWEGHPAENKTWRFHSIKYLDFENPPQEIKAPKAPDEEDRYAGWSIERVN